MHLDVLWIGRESISNVIIGMVQYLVLWIFALQLW